MDKLHARHSWNRRKQRQIWCSKIPETRGNSRKVANAQNFFVIESSSKILETRGNSRKVLVGQSSPCSQESTSTNSKNMSFVSTSGGPETRRQTS